MKEVDCTTWIFSSDLLLICRRASCARTSWSWICLNDIGGAGGDEAINIFVVGNADGDVANVDHGLIFSCWGVDGCTIGIEEVDGVVVLNII